MILNVSHVLPKITLKAFMKHQFVLIVDIFYHQKLIWLPGYAEAA